MYSKKGFTLIELMLVVIIIGVLVSMVVPRLAGRSNEAKIIAARADINANIAVALDLYEINNGKYPETLNVLTQKTDDGKGPYLKREPKDPWGIEYRYKPLPDLGHLTDYDLYSFGPDKLDNTGGGDDITNWDTGEK